MPDYRTSEAKGAIDAFRLAFDLTDGKTIHCVSDEECIEAAGLIERQATRIAEFEAALEEVTRYWDGRTIRKASRQ